jgi:hypothetical protein
LQEEELAKRAALAVKMFLYLVKQTCDCCELLHALYRWSTFCVFKEQEARTKLLRERVRDDSQSTSSAVCYDEPGHVNLFHEEEKGAGVRKFGYLLTSRLGQDMFNYHHCVVQLVSFLAGSINKCRV